MKMVCITWKITGSDTTKNSWKCPEVSLKIPTGVKSHLCYPHLLMWKVANKHLMFPWYVTFWTNVILVDMYYMWFAEMSMLRKNTDSLKSFFVFKLCWKYVKLIIVIHSNWWDEPYCWHVFFCVLDGACSQAGIVIIFWGQFCDLLGHFFKVFSLHLHWNYYVGKTAVSLKMCGKL